MQGRVVLPRGRCLGLLEQLLHVCRVGLLLWREREGLINEPRVGVQALVELAEHTRREIGIVQELAGPQVKCEGLGHHAHWRLACASGRRCCLLEAALRICVPQLPLFSSPEARSQGAARGARHEEGQRQ